MPDCEQGEPVPPIGGEARPGFFKLGAAFQAALVVLAVGLGALTGFNFADALTWDVAAVIIGLLAVLPMLTVFHVATRPRQMLVEWLGPMINGCSRPQLLVLSILAGVGEELLFRGALQSWIGRVDLLLAVVVVNLLFGLLHALTVEFALFAGLLGVYLSGLSLWPGEPNLLRPIIAHSVYDYCAFLMLVRDYRRRNGLRG